MKRLANSVFLGSLLSLALATPALADGIGYEPGEGAPRKVEAPGNSKGKKKKRARVPVFSGRLATAGELRDEPLDRPSGHLEFYAVNFREKITVELYNEDGSYNDEALDELNHLFRCRRTGTERAIDPRLFVTLSHIYDRFKKPLELVSEQQVSRVEST